MYKTMENKIKGKMHERKQKRKRKQSYTYGRKKQEVEKSKGKQDRERKKNNDYEGQNRGFKIDKLTKEKKEQIKLQKGKERSNKMK